MASVSFTPPLIVPMNPDFAKIRNDRDRQKIADARRRWDANPSSASSSPSASCTVSPQAVCQQGHEDQHRQPGQHLQGSS